MQPRYIVPLNLSKLGFRYFRIILESKLFSKKFIEYVVNHPNTGYVFEGEGWSGKKRVLGIGIWATSNAEITDIATHIRAVIPDSYKVVYQSELTRLEYFADTETGRKQMVLLDELEQKQTLHPIELDYLKLISFDGSLQVKEIAPLLGVDEVETFKIIASLKGRGVYYGVFEDKQLPEGYTKFFVDTAALSSEKVEKFYSLLKNDQNCVYFARGNGKYNIEFEYVVQDREAFNQMYKDFLVHSKQVVFDLNIFTNLFPQSKSLNVKAVQDTFIELAKTNDKYFDLRNSKLWYVSHEGTKAYLDIYSNENYKETMKAGEVGLFEEIAAHVTAPDTKFNLIDLGSGDGLKARALAEALGDSKIKSYFPVDIQELELAHALRAHTDVPYTVHPTVLGFDKLGARFPLASANGERSIFAMFGGTYGNFKSNEINRNLAKALGDDDKILISMPIRDFISREAIVSSYLNEQVEQVGFGALKQTGFNRNDFVLNKTNPALILQPEWIGDTLVQSFVLKNNVTVLGVYLEAGTKFDSVSSWKPSLAEFQSALEETFEVEKMFANRHSAIGLCRKKG